MSVNKYYDPFSAVTKNYDDGEKRLFDKLHKKQLYIIKLNDDEKIPINKSLFKIGTKRELCDYVITDSNYVGRYHARIITEDGQAFFEDNNSTNKSYINNKQVLPAQRIVLKNGDEIKLANVLLKFIEE